MRLDVRNADDRGILRAYEVLVGGAVVDDPILALDDEGGWVIVADCHIEMTPMGYRLFYPLIDDRTPYGIRIRIQRGKVTLNPAVAAVPREGLRIG